MTKNILMTHGNLNILLVLTSSFYQRFHWLSSTWIVQNMFHQICQRPHQWFAHLRTQPQYSSLPWCRTPHSCGRSVLGFSRNWSWSRQSLTGTSWPSWCPQSRSCTRRKLQLRTTANLSLGLNRSPRLPSTHHGELLRAVFGLLSSPLQLQSGGELL